MPKYVIEREMSGAGKLNSNQLKTLRKLQWAHLANWEHKYNGLIVK
jgi:hypothetical protein